MNILFIYRFYFLIRMNLRDMFVWFFFMRDVSKEVDSVIFDVSKNRLVYGVFDIV